MIRVIIVLSLEGFYGYYISGILASFSDIQTVLLACISTLLPLIIALGIAFGVRYANSAHRERAALSKRRPVIVLIARNQR